MLEFGASPESIELVKKQYSNKEDFEVHEENWKTVIFFLNLDTQWQIVAGMSGAFYTGIPATCIEAEMNMQQIEHDKRAQLRFELKLMEREALNILNKKDK